MLFILETIKNAMYDEDKDEREREISIIIKYE